MSKKEKDLDLPDLNLSEDKFDWEEELELGGEPKEDEGNGLDSGDSTEPKEEKKEKAEKKVEGKKNEEEDDDDSDSDDDNGNDDDTDGDEPESKNDDTDDSEDQVEVVEGLFDVISEKIGFDFDDKFEKPQSVEDLVDFFSTYIEESSKPEYSNDTVERLDQFIKDGGDFESFYKIQKEAIEYDTIDIEDESNQKRLISDYLELSGYNANQIAKKVNKYEESGILKDEAEDALESLKIAKVKEAERLEKEQSEAKKLKEKQDKETFNTIANYIKDTENVMGYKLSSKDRKDVLEYMFKVQPNGRTRWQEEYGASVENVVTSAFVQMKGKSLYESAKKTGETSAVSKLKKAMASNKVKGTKNAAVTGDVDDFLSAFKI